MRSILKVKYSSHDPAKICFAKAVDFISRNSKAFFSWSFQMIRKTFEKNPHFLCVQILLKHNKNMPSGEKQLPFRFPSELHRS